jgi:hypothetical protein
METDSISSQFRQLFEQVKVYFNLRVNYLRLYVAENLIRFFSAMVLWMVIFLFLFFVLVFGSFAFAYWFSDLTGKLSLGFLIVAGLFRRQILIKPFTKLIITHMELDKFNDLEDEKGE